MCEIVTLQQPALLTTLHLHAINLTNANLMMLMMSLTLPTDSNNNKQQDVTNLKLDITIHLR